MCPQFVDLNGDGHMDIVAGIFGGSPKVALGDGQHFAQPKEVLDKDGQRILMNQYWDYDENIWTDTDRCDAKGQERKGFLTSTWVVDWDGDGDLDLVIGDHNEHGFVMLRRNEGTRTEAKFATRNELIMVDGKPLMLKGGVYTLQMADWDADGRDDLLVSRSHSDGSSVEMFRNVGSGKAVELGAGKTLLRTKIQGDAQEAGPPGKGVYAFAVDRDGDGDLDLMVGGQTVWQPKARKLSEEEKALVAELDAKIAKVEEAMQKVMEEIMEEAGDMETPEGRERMEKLYNERSDELEKIYEEMDSLSAQRAKLIPERKQQTYVWYYERR